MAIEHSRDVQRVTSLMNKKTTADVLKDKIEVAKNIVFNISQAAVWGSQAEFISPTKHRVAVDSLQFKLNYNGAQERQKQKLMFSQKLSARMMTTEQAPLSAHGRFPVCVHYWWKSLDLVAIILNYIPMHMLGKVSLVCKLWYAASKRVSHVTLTKPIPGNKLIIAQSYYLNPISLEVISMYNVPPGVWFSMFSATAEKFQRLTALVLKDCSSIVDEDLVPVCEYCALLKSLDLVALSGVVRPKVSSLTLEKLTVEDCAWFEEIRGSCPSLQNVSLIRLNCMFGANFDNTCKIIGIAGEYGTQSNLKSFMMKQCNGITNLVLKNQSVETIRVLSCGKMTNCIIVAKAATVLSISQCYMLSSVQINAPLLDRVVIHDMKRLAQAEIICPIAQHATFQDIDNSTTLALQKATTNFRSLKSCRMVNIGAANKLPFGSEFACFKLITVIFISNCCFDDASFDIMTQFENLNQFELWDCASITCPIFQFCQSLKQFTCNQCPNLFSIKVEASGMSNFTVSKCHVLRELHVGGKKLSSLMINQCERVSAFDLNSEILTSLDLDNIHKLEQFDCCLPALERFSIKHAHEPPHSNTIETLFKSKHIKCMEFDDLTGFLSFDAYQKFQKWSLIQSMSLYRLDLHDSSCEFIQKMPSLAHLSIRSCRCFELIKLVDLPELKKLDIDECSALAHIVVSAPKITGLFVQNCRRLLTATLKGQNLSEICFRKTDSLFLLESADGGPSLKRFVSSKVLDIQMMCRTFKAAPILHAQISNQVHIIKLGELQVQLIDDAASA
jgi:hypothetical protein